MICDDTLRFCLTGDDLEAALFAFSYGPRRFDRKERPESQLGGHT